MKYDISNVPNKFQNIATRALESIRETIQDGDIVAMADDNNSDVTVTVAIWEGPSYDGQADHYFVTPPLIHWTSLELVDSDGCTQSGESFVRGLAEFRDTGGIYGLFFKPLEGQSTDPEDSHLVGPDSPDCVDWTGFDTETE